VRCVGMPIFLHVTDKLIDSPANFIGSLVPFMFSRGRDFEGSHPEAEAAVSQ